MQKKSPVPKNRRNFGYWRKKSWILPKRAGPRWNFNVGRPGRNTGNAPILAAADRRVSGLLIVGQLQLIKHVEYQAKDHSGDAGQHHTGELDVSKVHLNAGESGDEDHGSQGLVPVFAVVHLGIHQDPQAGGADHSIKQEGDPADDRAGDGLDQGRQLSDEGADDGKYGRAGDDLDAVYLGDGHNADVLPIGGGGNGADETGQHGGEIISEQTAVESRFL